MDKLYLWLKEQGLHPIYNKYDNIINADAIQIKKGKYSYKLLIYMNGFPTKQFKFSHISSLKDFINWNC